MLYELIRPLLFSLDPENAHDLTLQGLHFVGKLLPPGQPEPASPVDVMGLRFPNRIGLAAGLDKNGEAIDGLSRLGFGFLEIGTITPRPSPATRARACSGCPRCRASSTAWASTTTASMR